MEIQEIGCKTGNWAHKTLCHEGHFFWQLLKAQVEMGVTNINNIQGMLLSLSCRIAVEYCIMFLSKTTTHQNNWPL
jgi:hypothetical protein